MVPLGILDAEWFAALGVETVVLAPGCFLFLDCDAGPFPFALGLAEKVEVPGIGSFAPGALPSRSEAVVLTEANPRRAVVLEWVSVSIPVKSTAAGGAAVFCGADFVIFPFVSIHWSNSLSSA